MMGNLEWGKDGNWVVGEEGWGSEEIGLEVSLLGFFGSFKRLGVKRTKSCLLSFGIFDLRIKFGRRKKYNCPRSFSLSGVSFDEFLSVPWGNLVKAIPRALLL